jgi:hypothetical protein
MLSRVLGCSLEGWNSFHSVGIPLYSVGMLSIKLEYLRTRLECFRQSWNAFNKVGMLATELEYLCKELECFLHVWNASDRVGMLSTVLEFLCKEF